MLNTAVNERVADFFYSDLSSLFGSIAYCLERCTPDQQVQGSNLTTALSTSEIRKYISVARQCNLEP